MERRYYLRAAATAGAAGIAGCLADVSLDPEDTGTSTATQVANGVDLPVPESELDRGAPEDGIPAITEPAFAADWSGLTIETRSRFGTEIETEPRLSDGDRVLGLERDGEARAYPLKILNWHEIVNDDFGGPLLVTFCPLCGSGVTAERRVDGKPTIFGVSGLLYKNALVMYDDATESLWSQIMATAIRGERTGESLTLVPSPLTTWGSWREEHPDTRVLLPPPESNTVAGRDKTRDYTANPYRRYEDSSRVGMSNDDDVDDRLHPKETVVGVVHGGEAVAYSLEAVTQADGVVNDAVGGLPVVVTADRTGSLAAFVRRVDGSAVIFESGKDDTMTAASTTWNRLSGLGLDGRHEGTRLAAANDRSPMFWFAWADFFPETDVYGQE